MITLNAFKDGQGHVVVSEDSFEMILACLDNQKFVNSPPMNGDSVAEGPDAYYAKQQEIQETIDAYNRQCRDILHAPFDIYQDEHGYWLFKRYKGGKNLPWTPEERDLVGSKFPDTFLIERPLSSDDYGLTISEDRHENRLWTDDEVKMVNEVITAHHTRNRES